MIDKARANQIKAAWLKHRGFTETTHPEELRAFVEGMRAVTRDWQASLKPKENHLTNYQPMSDDMDVSVFEEYWIPPTPKK